MASKTRTPPKRTRRLGNPFDATIELRLYSTEKAKLFEEAKSRGLSASDLIRSQLGRLIEADPPQPESRAEPPEPETPPVDLIQTIADTTGRTVGQAMLAIRLGKVTVGGDPWTHSEIPEDLLPLIAVEGQPLFAD